jgi:hypothetical protein
MVRRVRCWRSVVCNLLATFAQCDHPYP